MISLAFPQMFASTKTLTLEDKSAIKSNLRLLLASDKYSLLGDPYFGTNLKQFIYEPNNSVVADLIVDEIFTAISTFMPQVIIARSDITLTRDKHNLFATIKYVINESNQSNLYTIQLTDNDEE